MLLEMPETITLVILPIESIVLTVRVTSFLGVVPPTSVPLIVIVLLTAKPEPGATIIAE